MTQYFIIPGLGNSGPAHWQSYFERAGPQFKRIEQENWDTPVCSDWVSNIDKALEGYDPANVVLIAHSLGCSTIAHWAQKYQRKIKGAFLVAPSDVEASGYNFPTTGFAPVPLETLPFPSVVVASTNDKWVSLDRARFFAEHWGSEFINIGEAGHINVDSGHGDWPGGLAILESRFSA